MKSFTRLMTATAIVSASAAYGADLEVTHWWTSGGEAAAVAEFAKAFNEKTEHNWVDGAIAGSGGTARPIIISRILGGDPMGATQLNHGRQAEELIEAGLMLDLTDVAEAEGWPPRESAEAYQADPVAAARAVTVAGLSDADHHVAMH